VTALPINFFDCLLVALLVAGAIRGRKQGISQDLFRCLKWLFLLFGCALVYGPIGSAVCTAGFFDLLSAFLLAYLGVALLIFLACSMIERNLAPKLVGSDAFGRSEYYLGMGSGVIRYACMVLVGLAVLNAREFTPAETKAIERSQVEVYGSTLFPTLRNIQAAVFESSFSGACIKNYLSFLLIQPTGANETQLAQNTGKPESGNPPRR
jgi:hypothetical protein